MLQDGPSNQVGFYVSVVFLGSALGVLVTKSKVAALSTMD